MNNKWTVISINNLIDQEQLTELNEKAPPLKKQDDHLHQHELAIATYKIKLTGSILRDKVYAKCTKCDTYFSRPLNKTEIVKLISYWKENNII